jgi:hypothetical protein
MIEVDFNGGPEYTLLLEKKAKSAGGFPLKIFQGDKLAFETVLKGETGQVCLINVRGEKRFDLIAVLAGADEGAIKDIKIIGSDDRGQIGLLLDETALSAGIYTWPRIIKVEGRTAIEFTPDSAWTRHRAWVEWDNEEGTYILIPAGRITPYFIDPVTDKTIYFTLGPEDDKIWYHDQGEPVTEVWLHTGTTMLLKRDGETDEEVAIGCRADCGIESAVNIKFAGGSYLISAKRTGITKLELFEQHNPLISGVINIIVE